MIPCGMCVLVVVWQPCELLYTCYLLTYLQSDRQTDGHTNGHHTVSQTPVPLIVNRFVQHRKVTSEALFMLVPASLLDSCLNNFSQLNSEHDRDLTFRM